MNNEQLDISEESDSSEYCGYNIGHNTSSKNFMPDFVLYLNNLASKIGN